MCKKNFILHKFSLFVHKAQKNVKINLPSFFIAVPLSPKTTRKCLFYIGFVL